VQFWTPTVAIPETFIEAQALYVVSQSADVSPPWKFMAPQTLA
jgi:hypothetical protein